MDHEGARLVVGVNVTPDRTRHSVTVRRDKGSGPDVIQLHVGAEYEVVDRRTNKADVVQSLDARCRLSDRGFIRTDNGFVMGA